MPEDEIKDILDLMLESIKLIKERFSKINIADEFVSTPEGITILDAIAMRLQVIGESVKRIQKQSPSYLKRYSQIEWDKIAKLRDLVSHHYEQIDHEIVYDICETHIPKLDETVRKMLIITVFGEGCDVLPKKPRSKDYVANLHDIETD